MSVFTCDCWERVNAKLKPMGVRLSTKLEAFRPTEDMDLVLMHQLPTEPLSGKFRGGMPKYISFPRCPFCGQSYTKEEVKP